jgi:hypothetical protein
MDLEPVDVLNGCHIGRTAKKDVKLRPIHTRSAAAGTTAGTMREKGPPMMPAGMNSTFSGAPIANAAAVRADRQS